MDQRLGAAELRLDDGVHTGGHLEREGLLTRTVHPTVPPCVEYRLTGLGREVGGLVQTITDWSKANIEAIEAARRRFDEHAATAPGGS